jgi:F5/8 type C domain
MTGDRLDAVVAGRTVAAVADASHTDGQVGLRVGSWDTAEFADLRVVPTEPPPQLVPASDLTVTASSELYDEHVNVDDRAQRMLNGRPATVWTSVGAVDAQHPATLTLTLHQPREVSALTVTPPRNGSLTGMVTSWRVETSADGHAFSPAAEGSWSPGTGMHTVGLHRGAPIRAVRLVITGSVGPRAALAELGLVADTGPSGRRPTGARPQLSRFSTRP